MATATKKATATKAAPAKKPTASKATATAKGVTANAAAADQAAPLSRATREGEVICPDCGLELPITKFPTYNAGDRNYERNLRECRSCRDARRAAKGAGKRDAEAKQ